jgi:hypothetical protein
MRGKDGICDAKNNQPERILVKLVGIILIIIGVLALAYQGFTYTKTEQEAKLGPLSQQVFLLEEVLL